jgi:hypothetical protein
MKIIVSMVWICKCFRDTMKKSHFVVNSPASRLRAVSAILLFYCMAWLVYFCCMHFYISPLPYIIVAYTIFQSLSVSWQMWCEKKHWTVCIASIFGNIFGVIVVYLIYRFLTQCFHLGTL